MVSTNSISLAFLLISFGVLLVISPAQVNAECECDKADAINGTETDKSGIAEFFHKVKCGLKHGAKQATDAAKDGYRFVKDKIFTDTTEGPNPQIDVRSGNTEVPIKLAPLP